MEQIGSAFEFLFTSNVLTLQTTLFQPFIYLHWRIPYYKCLAASNSYKDKKRLQKKVKVGPKVWQSCFFPS